MLIVALVGALTLAVVPGVSAGARPETRPAPAAKVGGLRFDRAGFVEEMAKLPGDLQAQPGEALQEHVRRLSELYAVLDSAGDLSPSERRAIGESILARVAQVGLVLRQRQGSRPEPGGAGHGAAAWLARLPSPEDLGIPPLEGSALLLGLVGGVIIAFALGSLTGYRRGTSQASYYGAKADPRIRFLARPAGQGDDGGNPTRVSATQLRDMLAKGRTVMLQLGYEVKPEMRLRYLELIGQMQSSMKTLEGQRYTVWEDPRHSNRFYELLVCSRPGALDRLAARDWRLAELAAEIESCRVAAGPVFRRAWWELPPSAAATREA